jgi:hypothetical protein
LRPATLPPHARVARLVSTALLFISRRLQLATLALKHTVSAIFPFREQADAGGLIGTGGKVLYRKVGICAGRILKGKKPAALPGVHHQPANGGSC